MKKIATRTARWVNGLGIEVVGAYQFDNENGEFVFRIIGMNGFTIPALFVIGRESFRWEDPQIVEVNN
jgi:hypothetical protein